MAAVDGGFLAVVQANPGLRPRVGNPDEMRSNRMQRTLDALKFRVTAPEPGIPEAVDGAVITALNEEAVASAALANKGGVNIVVTYEAFGTKMHGAVRQEIVFADHQRGAGRPPGWLSVALVLTSHTWENAKNERSHQDPSMAEALLGEPADVSRVLFPADHNTAAVVMRAVYQTWGQVWTLVVPKGGDVPDLFTAADAERLLADGAVALEWAGHRTGAARVLLTAIGAYQLGEVLRASRRLAERDVPHGVVYMLEPGRFREARGEREAGHQAPDAVRARLYPDAVPARVFLTHTRPETVLGVLKPLVTGPATVALGYTNHGGTLSVGGLLFVNQTLVARLGLQPLEAQAAFTDENGPKGGVDIRCGLTVKLPRRPMIHAEHVAETARLAYDGAAAALERSLARDRDRARALRRRPKKYFVAKKLREGVPDVTREPRRRASCPPWTSRSASPASPGCRAGRARS
jgi:phosphoketolase